MLQRCPACHATIGSWTACHRCGSDLSWLLKAEQQARHHVHLAVLHLHKRNLTAAEAALEQALAIHSTPSYKTLLAFVRSQSQSNVSDFVNKLGKQKG